MTRAIPERQVDGTRTDPLFLDHRITGHAGLAVITHRARRLVTPVLALKFAGTLEGAALSGTAARARYRSASFRGTLGDSRRKCGAALPLPGRKPRVHPTMARDERAAMKAAAKPAW